MEFESQAPEEELNEEVMSELAKQKGAKKGVGKQLVKLKAPAKVDSKDNKKKAKEPAKKKADPEEEGDHEEKESDQENEEPKGEGKENIIAIKKIATKEASKPKKDGKGKKVKKVKDPDAPKRARSAYIMFSSDQQAIVKKEKPELAAKERMSEIADRWKSLDAKEKKKYQDLAVADKTRYTKEMDQYVSGLDFNKKAAPKRKKGEDEDNDEDEEDAKPGKKAAANTDKSKGKAKSILKPAAVAETEVGNGKQEVVKQVEAEE